MNPKLQPQAGMIATDAQLPTCRYAGFEAGLLGEHLQQMRRLLPPGLWVRRRVRRGRRRAQLHTVGLLCSTLPHLLLLWLDRWTQPGCRGRAGAAL